jgi:hypothetical protein
MNALLAVPALPKTARRWNVEDFPLSAAAQLRSAADALRALAADDENTVHAIADALCNDTAENFQELRAQIETCFAALCEIEERTRWELGREAEYHRENLEAILALGVALEA